MKGTIVQGSRGRYVIHAKAGEGGAGTVYKAKDIDSGEVVAVKVLHSKRFELTDSQRTRFLNEIKASLEIESPYIVRALDSGEYEGEPFLVLEWLSGGNLRDLIDSGDYGVEDVISMTAQLLKGFRDLQRLGLVHRDLKPNNVLLTDTRRVKLGDLGLVRKVADPAFLTATEDRIGSLLYISERQRFSPGTATGRDDFYSLSLILYELISRQRVHHRKIPLSFVRRTLGPAALCRLIDQAMTDSPGWQRDYQELCSYLDLEAECINTQYTGSVSVPERVVQGKVNRLLDRFNPKRIPISSNESSDAVVGVEGQSFQTVLESAAMGLCFAFNDCALEIQDCGVAATVKNRAAQ